MRRTPAASGSGRSDGCATCEGHLGEPDKYASYQANGHVRVDNSHVGVVGRRSFPDMVPRHCDLWGVAPRGGVGVTVVSSTRPGGDFYSYGEPARAAHRYAWAGGRTVAASGDGSPEPKLGPVATDPVSDLLPTLVDFLADADQLLCGERGRWAAGEDLLPYPDSPLGLLLRIRTEAMHTFHALLRVTDDPMAAPAAPILVRQLLECWAHVHWIAEGHSSTLGSTATPEQRAICLELGMARWLCINLANSSNESQYDHSKADGEKWLNSVAAEHEQIGCTCSGRDFKAVRTSFKDLRDRFGMDWPLDTYITASAASHALMPQRLAHEEGTSLAWGGPGVRLTARTGSHAALPVSSTFTSSSLVLSNGRR